LGIGVTPGVKQSCLADWAVFFVNVGTPVRLAAAFAADQSFLFTVNNDNALYA